MGRRRKVSNTEFEPYFTWKGKRPSWKEQKKMFIELGKNKTVTNLKYHDRGIVECAGRTAEIYGFPKKISCKVGTLVNRIDKMGALSEYQEMKGGGRITVNDGASIYKMGGEKKSQNIWCFSERGVKLFGDLIEMNQPMVASQVSYSILRFGGDLDDLMQIGNMAMMHAARKFNPKFGYVFSTYAVQAMRTSFARKGKKKKALLVDDISIDMGSSGEKGSLFDIIPDSSRNQNTSLDDYDLWDRLSWEISDEQESALLMYLGQGKTLEETGELLGISKEWVRKLNKEAIEIMKEKARDLGELVSN
ncbi:sigma-70 family RNA polymerase sigma factor [archaeon]|jgi:RNA polymerase sigma factor (sigma-70 family)|nr:sigma-70 family RNA polymerase sigma factor [archaeon]MBT3577949.1 sigma-70 family RNA polymerase sigma factor [archaeon]MBT6820552.1 sigma-70 family RNA polymerase sigma factor [archaeon]MBT6956090.1 sigma-70 family RNA polymerase sigma factor [archaeon]MBT7025803.1 sigma-70 family RNA polymerase sigma factor [archaeon]